MKNKHIFVPLIVLCGVGVISFVASIIDFKIFYKQPCYSSQAIQFDYDGASDGLDPNGNAFDAVNFLTDDVIENALVKSELKDKYSVELVKQNVVMENVVPSNIVKEINSFESLTKKDDTREISSKDYHPIRYNFVLSKDIDKSISKDKLNGLLGNIVDSYCEKLYSTYKKSYNSELYNNLYDVENYDYTYQSEAYASRLKILADYADAVYQQAYKKDKQFEAFKNVSITCQALMTSEINQIDNMIKLHALSKDLDSLKNFYNYKIETLNYDKVKYTSDLTAISAQVAAYDKDSTIYVGSGESVIKVESNSAETYNALLAKQIELSDKVASISIEIADCESILDDINHATATDDEYVVVRNYIARLGAKFKAVEKDFTDLLDAYNAKFLNETMVSKSDVYYQSNSIISGAFVSRSAKIIINSLLLTLMGITIYYLVREIKKNKKKAA